MQKNRQDGIAELGVLVAGGVGTEIARFMVQLLKSETAELKASHYLPRELPCRIHA